MDGWKDLKAAGSSDDATAGLGKARQPKEGWEGQTYDGGGRGDRLWRKRRALGRGAMRYVAIERGFAGFGLGVGLSVKTDQSAGLGSGKGEQREGRDRQARHTKKWLVT